MTSIFIFLLKKLKIDNTSSTCPLSDHKIGGQKYHAEVFWSKNIISIYFHVITLKKHPYDANTLIKQLKTHLNLYKNTK